MVELNWPEPSKTSILGTRVQRLDGPDKATGRAKYTFDVNRPKMLWAKFTTCPHGHARIKSVDLEPAKKMKGVVAAELVRNPGDELNCAFSEVAVVAAESEEIAREAARRVKVEYEVLEHNVVDDDVERAGRFAKVGGERKSGDSDKAFSTAKAVSEGEYGCSILTHCCLESHGSVAEYEVKDGKASITAWCSTQAVSGVPGEFARAAEVDGANTHAICQHMGGGFGSKFGIDLWGEWAARLSKQTGRPVKAMLERDMEIALAGSRPSGFAKVRVAAGEDGVVTAFESHSWGSGGPGGGGGFGLPYVFTNIPNGKTRGSSISTHTGDARAWRAPNNPQMALLTMTALADCAAELGMDELEFFKKNLKYTGRPDVYAEELDKAAELIEWKKKWHPRGDEQDVVRRGLGISLHTWGGRPNDSRVQCTLHPDGTVEVGSGTQDLGVGTRTVLGVVAAETFGLPIDRIKVSIGDSHLPPAGGSGGSTTVGGVSSATRHACIQAVSQLFDKVAPDLGANPGDLAAKDGKVFVSANPSKSMSFADACRRLGTAPITAMGSTQAAPLTSSGVGGAQIAEVEVDSETGIVRVVKFAAVQDCGRIVDLLTAESQVKGAVIMGICGALYEERIMDPVTGTVLNPDMEFYKLAGIADVGEIVVHMMDTETHWNRGVIGLGEPPVISPMAAISNAVANALGVRVGRCPMTPDRVLAALKKGAT